MLLLPWEWGTPSPPPDSVCMYGMYVWMMNMSGVKITTVKMSQETVVRLAVVLGRENKTFTQWLKEVAEAYLKAHENGNPSVPLDKFIADPHYVACPTLLEAHHFNVRTIAPDDLPAWRAATFRFLQRLLDEEWRRKAGGTPE